MSQGSLVRAMGALRVADTGVIPQDFPQFPLLPTELRVIIWATACHQSRILELHWDGADGGNSSHHHYVLARKSRRPPSILSVNKEARVEALNHYAKVDFTTNIANLPLSLPIDLNFRPTGSMETYYNKDSDIIFFGNHTCMDTIVRFLRDQRLHGVAITRIAIYLGVVPFTCHDWNMDHRVHGPGALLCQRGYAIARGCTVMQAFHGIDPAVAWNSLALGVRELKEVFLVIPSSLFRPALGDIDEAVTFREGCVDIPRNTPGIRTLNSFFQIKQRIVTLINFVKNGNPLPGCGRFDYWSGPGRPEFRFVSLSPVLSPGRVSKAMLVPSSTFRVFSTAIFVNIARAYGCDIRLSMDVFNGQPLNEIVIEGSCDGVVEARKEVQRQSYRFDSQASCYGYHAKGRQTRSFVVSVIDGRVGSVFVDFKNGWGCLSIPY